MVKQTVQDLFGVTVMGGTHYCFQSPALLELQQAAETFLENMWDQVKDISTQRGETTVQTRDVTVWKRVNGFKIRHDRTSRSLCVMFDSLPPTKKV